MGTDDLFKKKREEKKARRSQIHAPQADSFLIVTEGEKTEPFYFNGLVRLIQKQHGGNLSVETVPQVDVHGEGSSPLRLVEKAEELVNKAKIMYKEVWIVFDKDAFLDFDEAIKSAKKNGYSVAWSNQSFEYWLFLHFNFSDSALHRNDWTVKVDECFQEYQLGRYEKNLENLYELVSAEGRVRGAIANAKRRMAGFDKKKYSTYDPGTKVHLLVEKLLKYLDET